MSVLSRHGRLLPLRIGFWRVDNEFRPDPLLCAVEPPMATMLELRKLSSYGYKVTYSASINRQCHTYAVTERRDARSHALHRVFTRCASWLQTECETSPSVTVQQDCKIAQLTTEKLMSDNLKLEIRQSLQYPPYVWRTFSETAARLQDLYLMNVCSATCTS